jgi:hypothetical protein
MPSYDFAVDMQSLYDAAKGTSDALKLFKDKDVEDLVPELDDLGDHDGLRDAVDDFRDRWEEGMNNLMEDSEEIAGRLSKILTNYLEFNTEAKDRLVLEKNKMVGLKVMEA